MISLIAVNDEIKDILLTDTRELTEYKVNKLRKRVEFLEIVKNYLESGATHEFVAKEKDRIACIIAKIKDGFEGWVEWNKEKGETYKQQRDAYEKEMELKKYKTQFKALDFILQ